MPLNHHRPKGAVLLFNNSFIPELGQHFQHALSELLRIIIKTSTDDTETIRCQYPAMQLVGLVLLVFLIFFILLHGDLPSSSQTGTCHPETAHLSALPHPDHSDQDDDY